MFDGKGRALKGDARELNTILGSGSVVEGKLAIQNSVRVEGRLVGEITSTGTVTVGPEGEVEGNVNAVKVIIGGKIKGGVRASDGVILEANGVLVGDVWTTRITIDEGAMFEGKCTMVEGKGVRSRSNGQSALQGKSNAAAAEVRSTVT